MHFLKLFLIFSLSIGLFGETINLNQIAKDAMKEEKTVLVFFHTLSCPYCNKMLAESFDNKKENDIINKDFYFVDINLDSDDKVIYKKFQGSANQFAESFQVQFYPTILFMENNVPIMNLKGYRNKGKFEIILKYISSKSYESMDLETFTVELEMKE